MRLTLVSLKVVRHLQTGPPEAALYVEALVRLAAVQDRLVATDLLGHEIESLDETQAQLLALLVLGDGNVLDVSDEAEAVDAVMVVKRERGQQNAPCKCAPRGQW